MNNNNSVYVIFYHVCYVTLVLIGLKPCIILQYITLVLIIHSRELGCYNPPCQTLFRINMALSIVYLILSRWGFTKLLISVNQKQIKNDFAFIYLLCMCVYRLPGAIFGRDQSLARQNLLDRLKQI